ncbi:uncharacterized protein N0V89_001603 [Didymosphaeria variabile]|uniref:Killer toxin Kp4 domain-containing protein n=1 Tax=Didymosphaeria variabile TaxID=1932322 RepID=A0A9W8XZP3_9PLEO|nr:uncharacterized protein N0V89_001603 [Didymosphaeria variabile]KAJ4361034.1 hypothetical protein N0V89_001603 [Didymosphaeria variabile]
MQFLQLLGALIWVVGFAAALPQSLVNDNAVNDPALNTTLPASVVNDPATNTTFANQTLSNSNCTSSGDCGITGPLPPIPVTVENPVDATCRGSDMCTKAGCPGAGDAIRHIIETLSYMKPSAKYAKGQQMACWYCQPMGPLTWGNGKHNYGICAWVEGPDGSAMTIDDAWDLLKNLPKECTQCGRNPTRDKGEIRVDYTAKIQGHCKNRNHDDPMEGPCPNY